MKIETIEVVGFKPSLTGLRAPYKSYDRSDTDLSQEDGCDFKMGDADKELAMRLCKAGRNHRKHMRMWYVYADITAPRYFWSELDTHVLGVVKNSESTIHTLYKEDICDELFEFDLNDAPECAVEVMGAVKSALVELQGCFKSAKTADEKNYYRRIMKQILPESFKQRRCVCMNYEALRHMYQERKNHRLPEWSEVFCDWVKTLPYSEFITDEEIDKD